MSEEAKLELIEGSGNDPVEMVRSIVQSLAEEGSEVVGIVVFAKNERTSELHTYVGSRRWPEDVADWSPLIDALRRTVDAARGACAVAERVLIGISGWRNEDVH